MIRKQGERGGGGGACPGGGKGGSHTKSEKVREACMVGHTNPETKVTTQGRLKETFLPRSGSQWAVMFQACGFLDKDQSLPLQLSTVFVHLR